MASNPEIRSGPYRQHREAVERSSRLIRREMMITTMNMFPSVDVYSLTQEERGDIQNFVEYAEKRLQAGAISSPAYHDELVRGDLVTPVRDLASERGHDSMHAFVAWLRTDRRSLVPSYMQGREGRGTGDLAELEEAYVHLFSNLYHFGKRYFTQMDPGHDPVLAAIESWEADEASTRWSDKEYGINFMKEHRLPQLEGVMRNVYEHFRRDNADRKISVYEFRRLAALLLERLRNRRAPGDPTVATTA